ncbi:putative DD41D transposase [Trichonephila clavipes]|nr:putative DD41D transposase [Trichonephila clavipes]
MYHEFEPSTAEDTPCKGAMHVKSVKSSKYVAAVALWLWSGTGSRSVAGSGPGATEVPSFSSLDCGSKLRGPSPIAIVLLLIGHTPPKRKGETFPATLKPVVCPPTSKSKVPSFDLSGAPPPPLSKDLNVYKRSAAYKQLVIGYYAISSPGTQLDVSEKRGERCFCSKLANCFVPRDMCSRASCDEAHFWLNGYVNKQNCRIWSGANPQVYVETPLHPEKLTVWCALWAGGILLQKR